MMSEKRKALPFETLEKAAAVLRVVAHPHRLRMIELLEDRDLTVGQLAEAIGLAPHACSQHLSMMKAHNILSSRREGKTVFYQVEAPQARSVIECIRSHGG